jgi:rare lipoprotein A
VSGRPIHAGLAQFLLTAALALTLLLSGCAKKSRATIPARIGSTETGIASWYGVPYNGRRAADGEIYDMEQLTAAHRTLPFNTWVEVMDLDNGKRVEVRVTDRGPFVDGRIIDLSLAAARSIDMLGPGTARVRLKIIPAPRQLPAPDPRPPAPTPLPDLYAVQAGVFSEQERAEAFAASLRDQYKDTVVIDSLLHGDTVWRVLVARSLGLDDANQLAAKVRDAVGQAIVIRNP